MSLKKRKKTDVADEDVRDVVEISDITEAQKALGVPADEEPRLDERYIRMSRILRTAKFAVLTVFIVFLLGMITIFSEDITTERFRYILKDLSFNLPSGADAYGEIIYASDSEMNFGIFRSDFVCVGKENVEIIDKTGTRIFSETLKYSKPKLLTCDKYLLIYDLSGYKMSLYNSFSCVYTETFPYPVSCAAVNPSGMFMVATRTDVYRTAVYIYNRSFEVIYKWYSNDKFIFDMLLSEDGKEFLLFTAHAKDGTFYTEILSGNVKSETLTTIYEKEDTLVLRAEYTGKDSFTVFCDNKILFFADSKELLRAYEMQSETPVSYSTGDGMTAIVFKGASVGAQRNLVVFDSDGNIAAETPLEYEISKTLVYDGGVFILQSDKIIRFDIASRTKSEYITDKNIIDIIAEDGVLFMMTGTRAYPMSIARIFTG